MKLEEGHKADEGKVQWRLFPIDALREVARVLMFGAYEAPRADGTKGYGPNNWEHVEGARERYYDAAMRHLTDWFEGKVLDEVSGRHTLAHAGCDVLFLLAFELRGKFGAEKKKPRR